MENSNNRNITLSTKVTAEQKAEFTKIAAKHNISLSEWIASILEINKDSYDKIGDPTLREIDLEMEIQKKERNINRLKALLESADHKIEVEITRADNAIKRRDTEILKYNKIHFENQQIKDELEKTIKTNIENKIPNDQYENKNLLLPVAIFSGVIGLVIGKK